MSNRNELRVGTITYNDANIYGGVKYKFDLCSGDQLELGETPCAEIKFTLDTKLDVGTELKYYTKRRNDILQFYGNFIVADVIKNTANGDMYDHICYDCMMKLDKDATEWNNHLTTDGWRTTPHTLYQIVQDMFSSSYLNMSFTMTSVNQSQQVLVTWPENGLTYRAILSYISAFCGGYARARYHSEYPNQIQILSYDSLGAGLAYMTNNEWTKRVLSEYTVPAIDKVIAKDGEGDAGYTSTQGAGNNPIIIEGNPLFYNDNLQTAINNIYNNVIHIGDWNNHTNTPIKLDAFYPEQLGVPFILRTTKGSQSVYSFMTNISFDLSGCHYEARGLSSRAKAISYADTTEHKNQARYNRFTRDLNETKSEIATLDGRVTTVSQTADEVAVYVKAEATTTEASTAPANPNLYDMWKDTSSTPPTYKRWNGSAWIAITETDYKNTSLINSVSNSATGVVFRNNLTDGTTTISGSNITTGTISGNRIDATTINANDLNMSGVITWNDLSSTCQSRVDSGKGDDNPYYIKSTYIDSVTIKSPTIEGNTINIKSGETGGGQTINGTYNLYGIYGGNEMNMYQISYYASNSPIVSISSPVNAEIDLYNHNTMGYFRINGDLDMNSQASRIILSNAGSTGGQFGTLTQRNNISNPAQGMLFFVVG